MADPAFLVKPLRAMPHLTHTRDNDRPVDVPALIRAYMRLGARVFAPLALLCFPRFRCCLRCIILGSF